MAGHDCLGLQPSLDFRSGESPLLAHSDRRQTSALYHPVDRSTVYLEEFLNLIRGHQIGHHMPYPAFLNADQVFCCSATL